MLRTALLLIPCVALIAAACSSDAESDNAGKAGGAGTSASAGGADAGDAGAGSALAGKSASAGSVNSAGDTAQGGGGPSGGGAPAAEAGAGGAVGALGGQGSGGDGASVAACPNVFGTYTITSSDGTCGTLNENAAQSIQGTDVACFAHFVSTPPAGAQGVNGGAALDMNGNFTGAMLYLDNVKRNPCNGTWNAAKQTMTVECGGPGDLCTVVLKLN